MTKHNKVEFCRNYGVNPESGKALKDLSKIILEKYAK
jgi:hypothetical protein